MITLKNINNSLQTKQNFNRSKICQVLLIIFIFLIGFKSIGQCTNMKDYKGIIATISKGTTAGQSFIIDAECANGNNVFEYFEINHQSPWDNTLTLKIYEEKKIDGDPRFIKNGIKMDKVSKSERFKIMLDGGVGDLSFEDGKIYTFTLTPEDNHFRWNGDRNSNTSTSEALWPNNGGTWVDDFNYFYKVGTKKSGVNNSVTQTQLDEFNQKFPNLTPKTKTIVQTYVEVEDLVISGDYSGASQKLNKLWVLYPKGSDVWDFQPIEEVWLGIPAAYNGLRALDDVVSFHLNNTPCTDPIAMNIKVVLVGKSKGLMPNNLNDIKTGTGGTSITKTIDPRLKADDYKLIKDLLFVFSEYIEATTNGSVKLSIEVISLSDFEYPVTVREGADGKISAYGNADPSNKNQTYPNIWDKVTEKAKNSTDLWWIMYPSFVPGIGENPDLSTTSSSFKETSFLTGGKSLGPNGEPILFIDDLFFLEKQLHSGGGDLTDIERRCYAAMWFQHEYFHYLFDAFPNFKDLYDELPTIQSKGPDNLEASSHSWFSRDKWPKDFDGKYEADYFHEAMDKRLKLVEKGPLVNRIIIRRDAIPVEVLEKLEESDVVGHYENLEVLNGHHEFSITKDKGNDNKYTWGNLAGNKYTLLFNLSDGIFKNGPGLLDVRLQLKFDINTCKFVPEVIGLRHSSGLMLKK